ncbi:MAG: hypothetical protein ACK5GU_10790 [Chloroflexota bacterium]|jgi:hypothetical protein
MVAPKSLIWIVLVSFFLLQSTGIAAASSTQAGKATVCRDVTTSNPTTVITKERHTILVAPLECLPTSMLQRALRQITESQTMVSPDWTSFYFGANAIPMYRPDIGTSKPAYYEIEVFSDVTRSKSAGYIVLTNPATKAQVSAIERIDYPIAHWNSRGKSVTTTLLQKSKVATGNVLIWKMDTLSYVATRNNLIAGQLGNMPMPLSGLTQTEFNTYAQASKNSSITDTATRSTNDTNYKGTFTRTTSGPNRAEVSSLFSFIRPTSFSDYTAKYATGFQPLLNSLRKQTLIDWTYEEKLSPSEGVYKVPVPESSTTLFPIPFAGITSSDVLIIDTNNKIFTSASLTQSRTQQFPMLRLVTGSLGTTLKTATARVSVGGVVKMNITFYLIDKDSGRSISSSERSGSGRSHGNYQWHTFSAGTDAHQRMYNQFSYLGCAVGCGSVAWMMLFGWYDYRASAAGGSVYGRWNTFREGGVASGNPSNLAGTAPVSNNPGVETAIKNIRNRIGTFCALDSGATPPWNMPNASGYLTEMRTGLGISSHWNSVGYHEDGLRDMAIMEISSRGRPVVIGTGLLAHYPLAYKYRWYTRPETWDEGWLDSDNITYVRQFYVNQGWGGNENGWVSAGTWFVGRGLP